MIPYEPTDKQNLIVPAGKPCSRCGAQKIGELAHVPFFEGWDGDSTTVCEPCASGDIVAVVCGPDCPHTKASAAR